MDVLKLWTILDDHSDGSDELDQLEVNDIISNQTLFNSNSKLKSPTKENMPQKLAHETLKLKNSNTVKTSVSATRKPQGTQSIKSAVSSENSARRSREIPCIPPASARATKRTKTHDPDQTRASNASISKFSPSPGQSSLADALSLAFNKNAEEPYPSPRALVGSTRGLLKRQVESRGTIAPAINGNRHRVHATNLSGPRKTGKRKVVPPSISQEEINEYLDVHILPIHDWESRVEEDVSMANVNDAAINPSTPQPENNATAKDDVSMANVNDAAINPPTQPENNATAKESQVLWQTTPFNLRHVMAGRRHTTIPFTKTMPSYRVSPQSYTAMYLERAGQWFGDHDPQNGPEMEEPEEINDGREYIINPSPQIPRRGLSSAMNDWDDQTTTSFETDDVMIRDDNATPAPESDDGQSVTLVNNGLAGPVKVDSDHGEESHSEASKEPTHASGDALANAITLLQRLVKGKIKLSEEEVQNTRRFLETLGSSSRSIYSDEFQKSTLEDRAWFLQLVSRLCSRTASTLDLPGVPEGEARLIKKNARIVAQKYDPALIEKDR